MAGAAVVVCLAPGVDSGAARGVGASIRTTAAAKLDVRLSVASMPPRLQSLGARRDRGLRVVVEAKRGHASAVRAAVRAVGGRVEAATPMLVQALVRSSALPALTRSSAVSYVRPPFAMRPDAMPTEGVSASNSSAWHAAGITGTGVRIAIIDSGFAGYRDRVSRGELPTNVTPVDFCGGQLEKGTPHGAAVAEIVYGMAPGASLYLLCVNSEVTLAQAETFAKTNGIKIINHSVSWFNTSRGDGSGGPQTPDGIARDARANGILWVGSAGNFAQGHWAGAFVDADADGFTEFAGNDETNALTIPASATVCAYLKWDEWPSAVDDFDLYLLHGSGNNVVTTSTDRQTGTRPPTEELCYTNQGATDTFSLAVNRVSGAGRPRFDLFISVFSLEYATPEASVTEPASSPSVLAVGAVCWQDRSLEPYSSRGPTIDGHVKPDLMGQDSISTATFGPFTGCNSGFRGTSAAAPAVAGAAALVKQRFPAYGPAEIQGLLEGTALDLGNPGKDPLFGSGELLLPGPSGPFVPQSPPATPPPPPTGTSGSGSGNSGGSGSPPTVSPPPPPPAPPSPPPAAEPPKPQPKLAVRSFATRVGRLKGMKVLLARLAVAETASGTAVSAGGVSCAATASGAKLRVVVNAFKGGLATCGWRLPARTAGAVARGLAEVKAQGVKIGRGFSLKLR